MLPPTVLKYVFCQGRGNGRQNTTMIDMDGFVVVSTYIYCCGKLNDIYNSVVL